MNKKRLFINIITWIFVIIATCFSILFIFLYSDYYSKYYINTLLTIPHSGKKINLPENIIPKIIEKNEPIKQDNIIPEEISYQITPLIIFQLVNQERIKIDLQPYEYNISLEKVAYDKIDLINEKQVVSHYKIKEAVNAGVTGENIAWNFVEANAVIEGWLNSPKHRALIYDKDFDKTGIAVEEIILNGVETIMVVQEFSD